MPKTETIKCPQCGAEFPIDESDYTQIVNQVRNKEFNKEVNERNKILEEKYKADLESELSKKNTEHADELRIKDEEISKKDLEILSLKNKEESFEKDKELAIKDVTSSKDQEISELKNKYETELSEQKTTIEYYKDLKLKQSTKMLGETLEQHCQNAFNKIRAYSFNHPYFEKDNDASSGSKGDYIFRDYDDNGTEFISIMFDMKNEQDTTATKHKNEDFLAKLDKDRKEKKCEYAVLVSLLEADNDFYNDGIVDVSYRYPKMYVIRPQFFIPIISFLYNAALNSLQYREELNEIKAQQVDLTTFEENLNQFKTGFKTNVDKASSYHQKAIKEIDAAIKQLEKIKGYLTSSDNELEKAENRVNKVTIKKLTQGAQSIQQIFNALEQGNTEDIEADADSNQGLED